ncbi:PTS glucose transporter subunit IIA [Clostridiales bacterium COT073_COT-073]|nr:PTS glucose transporter subunit IIA [Clostridiales bacterium COT073_COT-073]
MKDNKVFGVMQRVGRSFMLPIAILPVAGLFLGIGGSFTNATMLEAYGLTKAIGPGTAVHMVLSVMNAAGSIVFANLPIIFAIGVAIGMAKAEKATAALAGAIAFFVMHASLSAVIMNHGGPENLIAGATTDVLGITSLQMGVFGGIIVGLGVAALHNRYYKIELPQVLSFFGGTRFVPIISSVVYLAVGILMFFVWPPVQSAINTVGDLVRGSGYPGTWLYGFMERALIPFGLHHVFYLPFWQTSVGGSMEVAGKMIEGAQNIFFAQLADPNTVRFSSEATRFMSGKFPLMIFGLPGAALAMYQMARPEKRKIVGGLLISAALTSMLTGITEPLEFTFLFVAPFLYVIHSVLAGLAYMLMHVFEVGVGMTFSGGFIDMFLFGILQGNAKTNWVWIVFVGIGYFVAYYFIFSFIIRKWDLKTPGREADDEETKLYTRADMNKKTDAPAAAGGLSSEDQQSRQIIQGLGGKKNIVDVDNCITRLRITVTDGSLVNDDILKASGAAGIVKSGNGIQVIYGPRVSVIKSHLEEYMERAGDDLDMATPIAAAPTEKAEEQKKSENTAQENHQEITIYAPLCGQAIPLSEVPDPAFSAEILGKGMAIKPKEGLVKSPVEGTVELMFETGHAVALKTAEGAEVLIHVGMDTVQLKGKGFETLAKAGDYVKPGDDLIRFDMELIEKEGYQTVTPIVITNSDNYAGIEEVAKGEVQFGDVLYRLN